MKTLPQNKLSDAVLTVRIPEDFYKSIQAKAKRTGITLTDYVSAVLIAEMKTGKVLKDIKKQLEGHNMSWAIYPRATHNTPKRL